MILKIVVGKGLRGADSYISAPKRSPVFIASNMAGSNARERAREFGALRSARPRLGRAAAHLILSTDPTDRALSVAEWVQAVDIARAEHGLADAAYVAYRHAPDKDHAHDHVHLVFCRVRPDGSVVSDSRSYAANERAARRIEARLSLSPPAPKPLHERIGDRAAADRARRRAERRGTAVSDPLTLIRAVVSAGIGRAKSWDDLRQGLETRGVDAELVLNGNGEIQGWKLRSAGADEWLKASTVHRSLSWSSVARRLAENSGPAPGTNVPPKPPAPVAPKSPWRKTMDPTKELAPPTPVAVPPVPVPALALTTDELEFQRALRKLKAQELHQLQRELEDLPRGDRSVDLQRSIQQLLERLLALVVRILTAGKVRLPVSSGPPSDEARQHLATAIDAELQRRADAEPRASIGVERERAFVAERGAAASAELAKVPSTPDDLLVHARVAARRALDLPGLQAVHAKAQRTLDEVANSDPGTGLLARLGGAVARHEEAMARALRSEATAAAAVQAAQRQAEQDAMQRYLPQLQANVHALSKDVAYWRRRSERLERELAAARAIEARPAVDVPAEQEESMGDGEDRQRPRRQRGT